MRRGLNAAWAALIVTLSGAAFAQAEQADGVVWYAIVADDGATLGHATLETAPRQDGGRDIIETQELYFREQGDEPSRVSVRSVRTDDEAGRTVSISGASQSGRFSSRTDVRIAGHAARIERETPSGRWSETVVLPAGVQFDDGEALLRDWAPETTPRLEFRNFNADAMSVERVVIEAAPGSARDAEGRITARRMRYAGDELVGVARFVVGRDGRLDEVAQPMFGATIRTSVTDRETALRPHPPYQVVPNVMIRSPFRISPAASHGHVRYRLAFRDGIAFPAPQTGEQRAVIEAGVAVIDVCEDCGPGLPADAETLARALRPTAWLQSDAPRLRELAAPVARLNVSQAHKMELLIERARPYIARIDFNGHYSALDTMERRAGDCTEAAVLLAALGRAAGIPTRVANGLTYSRASYHGVSSAFIPHSWTLAFVDGVWRSFDLALNEFDSTHIALSVGDGDARSVAAAGQLASLVRFDTMAEVRRNH